MALHLARQTGKVGCSGCSGSIVVHPGLWDDEFDSFLWNLYRYCLRLRHANRFHMIVVHRSNAIIVWIIAVCDVHSWLYLWEMTTYVYLRGYFCCRFFSVDVAGSLWYAYIYQQYSAIPPWNQKAWHCVNLLWYPSVTVCTSAYVRMYVCTYVRMLPWWT